LYTKVLEYVETVAATDSTVLLLGETGTGKELIVRAIHKLGRRKKRPLVKLNCAAIQPDLPHAEAGYSWTATSVRRLAPIA